jgi:hypothetical protein
MGRTLVMSRQIIDSATGEIISEISYRKVPRQVMRTPSVRKQASTSNAVFAKVGAELTPIAIMLSVVWALLTIVKS